MKKLTLFTSLVCFVFFSCTSGDNVDSGSNATDVLIKKIVSSDGLENNYNYNGIKLIKITIQDGSYANFTYTGDLITKLEMFDANNRFQQSNEFIYSSNKLTQVKFYGNTGLESVYNSKYNTDGSVTVTRSDYNGVNFDTSILKLYFDASGNLIKSDDYNKNNILISSSYFTYDTKNTPTKNITGFDNLGIYSGMFMGGATHKNNLIKETHTYPGNSQIYTDAVNSVQYNDKDYPVSATLTRSGKTKTETYYY